MNIIKFNPIASDIIATAGFDFLIKIWNLTTNSEVAVLEVNILSNSLLMLFQRESFRLKVHIILNRKSLINLDQSYVFVFKFLP